MLALIGRVCVVGSGSRGPSTGPRWAAWRAALECGLGISPRLLLLLLLSIVTLFLLSIYHMGIYDNIAMRVSVPALFLMWACAARILCGASAQVRAQHRLLYGLVALVVGLGFLTSAPELARNSKGYRWQPPAIASVANITNLDAVDLKETKLERVGDEQALFFRYLGR